MNPASLSLEQSSEDNKTVKPKGGGGTSSGLAGTLMACHGTLRTFRIVAELFR
jgi:hypothetical protein